MPRGLRDLFGYSVQGTDGGLGKLEDFFFDDTRWSVRHIAVRIGHWPVERYVLLPPQATVQADRAAKRLRVGLTTEQIQSSPDMDCDLPVACQKQVELSKYYTRALAWGGLVPPGVPMAPSGSLDFDYRVEVDESMADPNLRSVREIIGYRVERMDGSLGKIRDFLVDLSDWHIYRLLVETGGWLRSRRVELPPDCIRSIQWASRCVRVTECRQQIGDLSDGHPTA